MSRPSLFRCGPTADRYVFSSKVSRKASFFGTSKTFRTFKFLSSRNFFRRYTLTLNNHNKKTKICLMLFVVAPTRLLECFFCVYIRESELLQSYTTYFSPLCWKHVQKTPGLPWPRKSSRKSVLEKFQLLRENSLGFSTRR